jgi:ABC-type uncharacterized transport system substrate-binding protein
MKKAALFFIIFLVSAAALSAHPHMFIDSKVTFQFNENGLEGYWVAWWFDGGFTAMILTDYDIDKNGSFSPAEVREIEAGAFSNLENYGYFMFITVDGVSVPAATPVNFNAYLDGKRLVYEFFVPLSVPGPYDWTAVKLAIYDETFFCDIAFIETQPVTSRGYYSFEVASEIAPDPNIVINYNNDNTAGGRSEKRYTGYANPMTVKLQFRKK